MMGLKIPWLNVILHVLICFLAFSTNNLGIKKRQYTQLEILHAIFAHAKKVNSIRHKVVKVDEKMKKANTSSFNYRTQLERNHEKYQETGNDDQFKKAGVSSSKNSSEQVRNLASFPN
jgi:hypothetical protein